MKIKYFLLLTLFSILIFSGNSAAQGNTVANNYGTVLPATCDANQETNSLFFKKNDGLYYCSALNTWTRFITTAGGGSAVETVVTQQSELDTVITTANANTSVHYSVIINGAVPVTTVKTIPKNVALYHTNNGKFIRTGSGRLTILGGIIAPRTTIFSGFDKTNLLVSGAMDKIYPEWFGAVGDRILPSGTINPTPTDNYPAFQLMFDTVRTPVSAIMTTAESGRFLLDAKTYYFTNTPQIFNGSVIEGASLRGTVLDFAPNVSGLRFNGAFTEDGGVKPYARNSDSSVLRNLTLRGAAGGNTHTVNAGGSNGLTLTRTSGDIFFADANGLNTGVSSGYTVNMNGWDWVVKFRNSNDSVTLYPFRLYVYKSAANQIYFAYPATTQAQADKLVGAKILFPTDRLERTILTAVIGGGLVTLAFDGADIPNGYAGDAEITSLVAANFTGENVRFNRWSGIDARIKILVENVYITGFAGHGVRADAQAYPSIRFDGQPNLNNSRFVKIFADSNHGAGFYARGLNSNQMTIEQMDTGNNAISIYDSSFLGNSYKGIHSNSDRQGTWIGISPSQGYNAYGSQVLFGYIEDGQPSVLLGGNSTWYDGDVGTGFAAYYSGAPNAGFYSGNHIKEGSPNVINRISSDGKHAWQLGRPRGDNRAIIFGFGNASDAWATNAALGNGAGQGFSYHLTSPLAYSISDGSFLMEYGGITGANSAKVAFGLTTSTASVGGGRFFLPNGAFFGTDFGVELNHDTRGLVVNKNFKADTLQTISNGSQPACNSMTRGTQWLLKGGAGSADKLQVCLKGSADTYSWINMVIAP
ncbi:hypothetical protein BH24ACI2_BH24ACI2_00380 [soil metagenome]|jgi:hypothetical protein|nr:hypothetical protein [Acidobacteriota bacterium]